MDYDYLTGSAAVLQTVFSDHAAKRGEHVWCTFEGKEHTYASIDAQANQLAHALRDEAQIEKGDAVAVCMANCAEYFVVMFAIHRLGGVIRAVQHELRRGRAALPARPRRRAGGDHRHRQRRPRA